MVPVEGENVWGVVYEIKDANDVENLDRREGVYSGAYVRKNSERVLPRDTPKQSITVSTYFAVPQDNPPRPSAAYMALIVNGAKFWNLPAEYVAQLEQIVTAE